MTMVQDGRIVFPAGSAGRSVSLQPTIIRLNRLHCDCQEVYGRGLGPSSLLSITEIWGAFHNNDPLYHCVWSPLSDATLRMHSFERGNAILEEIRCRGAIPPSDVDSDRICTTVGSSRLFQRQPLIAANTDHLDHLTPFFVFSRIPTLSLTPIPGSKSLNVCCNWPSGQSQPRFKRA